MIPVYIPVYIKMAANEFRANDPSKTDLSPEQLREFLTSWHDYVSQIYSQVREDEAAAEEEEDRANNNTQDTTGNQTSYSANPERDRLRSAKFGQNLNQTQTRDLSDTQIGALRKLRDNINKYT